MKYTVKYGETPVMCAINAIVGSFEWSNTLVF